MRRTLIRRSLSRSVFLCTRRITALASGGKVTTLKSQLLMTTNIMANTAKQDSPSPTTSWGTNTLLGARAQTMCILTEWKLVHLTRVTPLIMISSASYFSMLPTTLPVKKLARNSCKLRAAVPWTDARRRASAVKSSEPNLTSHHCMHWSLF